MNTSGWWTAPCDCQSCALANTPRVMFEGGNSWHGVQAAKFIASRERGMASVSELGEWLRQQFGIPRGEA